MAVALAATPSAAQEVARHVLPNGLTVLVAESRSARVVAVSLQLAAGSGIETEATAGITNFVQRVMLRGTRSRSGEALVEAAERLGGGLAVSGDVDHAELSGRALARHVDTLLGLLAEVALEPAFLPAEIERERRLIGSEIRSRDDTPLGFAMERLLDGLYGPHPYALPPAGRHETIRRLERDDLVAHHRSIYRPDRVVLAVSGDVDSRRVLATVARVFGPWARPDVPAPSAASTVAPVSPGGDRRLFERPVQQAQVLAGYVGPGLTDPGYAAVKVMSALLGGGAGSRMFAELRERHGFAYAVGVVNPTRLGPAPIVAQVGTDAANVDRVEAALRDELERIRVEVPSGEELARAKALLLGNLTMDRRTNARRAWYLAFFELAGVGWDFPERYADAVRRVTAEEVTTAARRWLERPTVVVLRPARR